MYSADDPEVGVLRLDGVTGHGARTAQVELAVHDLADGPGAVLGGVDAELLAHLSLALLGSAAQIVQRGLAAVHTGDDVVVLTGRCRALDQSGDSEGEISIVGHSFSITVRNHPGGDDLGGCRTG